MKAKRQYAPKLTPGTLFEGELQDPARYIPDDAYISDRDLAKREDPTRGGPAVYPTYLGSEHLLLTFLEVCDISKYQLGKILGCKHDSHVWQWFNGHRRPGALYLSRMWHLLMLTLPPDPIPIQFISSIDWGKSEITWRTGLTTTDDHYWPGVNAAKKNQGKRVPNLVGCAEFDRRGKEIPVQRAEVGRSGSPV